jgi:phospholipid/cholesterol/gamma-HCH transport system substrate-binding protein
MESHAKYTLVGAVVLTLLGLTIFAALWLSRAGDTREYTFYAVYFRHHSLAGLQEDSAVTMRGIKVGTVKSLEIATPDVEQVKVVLKIESETPVKTDTEAVVQRNLLTGLAYIDLVRTTANAPLLSVKDGEELPVIPEGRSQLDAIASDLPRMIEHFNALVADARGFLTPENQKAAAAILTNLHEISNQFSSNGGDLSGFLSNLTKLSGDLDTLVKKIDLRTEELTRALKGTSSTISLETQNISRNLGRAAQGIAQTVERYQDPASLLGGPPPGALGPGER